MEYISYGIILSSQNFRESDKIYNIFSKEKGLIRAMAKSVSSPNSKLSGFLISGNYCIFMLAKRTSIDKIAQVKVLETANFLTYYNCYRLFNQIAEVLLGFLSEDNIEYELFDSTFYFLKDLNNLELSANKKSLLQILYFSDLVREFGFMPNWFNLRNDLNIFLENILKYPYLKNREAMLKLNMSDIDLKIIKIWFKNYLESAIEKKLNSF